MEKQVTREQEDLEADNTRKDVWREQRLWQKALRTFIGSVDDYDKENGTRYAAYLNESTDTFSDDTKVIAGLLRTAVESTFMGMEESGGDDFDPFQDKDLIPERCFKPPTSSAH